MSTRKTMITVGVIALSLLAADPPSAYADETHAGTRTFTVTNATSDTVTFLDIAANTGTPEPVNPPASNTQLPAGESIEFTVRYLTTGSSFWKAKFARYSADGNHAYYDATFNIEVKAMVPNKYAECVAQGYQAACTPTEKEEANTVTLLPTTG